MGVVNKKPDKGVIVQLDQDGQAVVAMRFQYNPTSVQRTLASNWTITRAPTAYRGIPMWGQHGGQQISMELFLYAREGDFSCAAQQRFLELCLAPQPLNLLDDGGLVTMDNTGSPPLCLLDLGPIPRRWFGIITAVDFREEAFDRSGWAVRVRARVTFEVVLPLHDPNLEGDDLTVFYAEALAGSNVLSAIDQDNLDETIFTPRPTI